MAKTREELAFTFKRALSAQGMAPLEWRVSEALAPYQAAVEEMQSRAAAIAKANAGELVWLLQHPPLYTAGTTAAAKDLLQAERFPVYPSGRGGQYTYHGPGQRVVYVMLDLSKRTPDVRRFVSVLEQWIINTLAHFSITGERREDRVGVWVKRFDKEPLPDGSMCEDKIAAIGIRIQRWVSLHGISINVSPELEHFSGIVPCGVANHGVTSLADLGIAASLADVDFALKQEFSKLF